MFFTIAKTADYRFPNHYNIGSWILSTDDGWHNNNNTWFKGYVHNDIEYGLWTKICYHDDHINIDHAKLRGYPLWWNAELKVLTNLLGTGQIIWIGDQLKLTFNDLIIDKVSALPEVHNVQFSRDQVLDQIQSNFLKKMQCMIKDYHDIPKKLFLSGGIDTLTLYALCKKADIEVDLVDYEFFHYDIFTNLNFDEIKKHHWAYQQIHHWTRDTLLLTGSCGDEFMFRGPVTVALWLAWHDIDIKHMLSKHNGYHVAYLSKHSNLQILTQAYEKRRDIQQQYPTKTDLIKQILNINANDFQHWHLGRTLTWSPFHDLELTKLMLSLPIDDIVDQILDAGVSKSLIAKLDDSVLDMLCDSKNINSRKKIQYVK